MLVLERRVECGDDSCSSPGVTLFFYRAKAHASDKFIPQNNSGRTL